VKERQKGVKYPLCVDGERACPPAIIMDPDHKEHDSMLEWAGGEFHPEHFACPEVAFDDPAERLEMLDEDF
jgi:Plasmid pRiA4b ORF-3-like protein